MGESLGISSKTIHHCVLMMDIYTSQTTHLAQPLREAELQLVAVSCLMISTKYYEMKYPSAQSLNTACRNQYSQQQVIDMEGQVLKVAEWELLRYTILDYVELFMNQGCLFESDELITSSGQVTSFSNEKNRNSMGGVNSKSPPKNKTSKT